MFDVGMFGIKVVKKRDNMHGHFFTHMVCFFHSISVKKCLIFSLLNRCFTFSSTSSIFLSKLEKLKTIFMKNSTPKNFLTSVFVHFCTKIFSHTQKSLNVPKSIVYFSLPFTSQHFLHSVNLKEHLCSSYPKSVLAL